MQPDPDVTPPAHEQFPPISAQPMVFADTSGDQIETDKEAAVKPMTNAVTADPSNRMRVIFRSFSV